MKIKVNLQQYPVFESYYTDMVGRTLHRVLTGQIVLYDVILSASKDIIILVERCADTEIELESCLKYIRKQLGIKKYFKQVRIVHYRDVGNIGWKVGLPNWYWRPLKGSDSNVVLFNV